jgi:hypothetical protein
VPLEAGAFYVMDRGYGTSENAVKAQIWIAVSAYVLVAIMKKRLKIETILQVLIMTIFE